MSCRVLWPTHRKLLLQADAERLGVVGFQLLQGHSRLPNELIVAEFVLITHGDPGGQGQGQLFRHTWALSLCFQRGFANNGWGVGRQGQPLRIIRLGWGWGGSLWPLGLHPPQGLSDHVFICDPVVSEGLIPCGVQGVSESFCSELICLECTKKRSSEHPGVWETGKWPQSWPCPHCPELCSLPWQRGIKVVNRLTLKQIIWMIWVGPM